MYKCSFCSTDIETGTGKLYIEKTGKMFWFCGSKCEKNMIKLGRDPRNFKWTRAIQVQRASKGHERS